MIPRRRSYQLLTKPQLRKKLPQLEMEYITKGDFFLNLHIVTGRKPKWPRPGDLLLDGTRQEMTTSKYSQMAKLNDAKSNQWKRFDLDGKLTHMMETLGAMPTGENGVPESKVSTPLPMTPNPVPSKDGAFWSLGSADCSFEFGL